jgi:hypothetical protein
MQERWTTSLAGGISLLLVSPIIDSEIEEYGQVAETLAEAPKNVFPIGIVLRNYDENESASNDPPRMAV